MNIALGIIATILRYIHWGLDHRPSWFGIIFFLNTIIILHSIIALRQSISRYGSYWRILNIFKDNKNYNLIENLYNNENNTLFFTILNFLFWIPVGLISNTDLFLRYFRIADLQNMLLYSLIIPIFLIFLCISLKKEVMQWIHKRIVKQ